MDLNPFGTHLMGSVSLAFTFLTSCLDSFIFIKIIWELCGLWTEETWVLIQLHY